MKQQNLTLSLYLLVGSISALTPLYRDRLKALAFTKFMKVTLSGVTKVTLNPYTAYQFSLCSWDSFSHNEVSNAGISLAVCGRRAQISHLYPPKLTAHHLLRHGPKRFPWYPRVASYRAALWLSLFHLISSTTPPRAPRQYSSIDQLQTFQNNPEPGSSPDLLWVNPWGQATSEFWLNRIYKVVLMICN